jgi:hypothetical protein
MTAMNDIQGQIFDRIRKGKRGKVFTPKDFLDLSSRHAVDKALSRLAKGNDIRRLGRGLYHFPRTNLRLGITPPPDTDEIADALARQTGTRIAPSGATAANRLGLSTQVPAKPIYLTDGRSRQVRIGKLIFVMKHVAPKDLPVGSRMSATVFQALRYLGKSAVNPEVIMRIRRNLSAAHRAKLVKDARYSTDWVAETVREIARGDSGAATNG